ncbi:Os08g0326900 [Oryza sativa Japonica Group]|uniref:Os08g0326900 protein n=1 Tax=Oryza sativa subsp. japonica TaxID=39947 RepID=A0A0P0XEF7_ORYSJ|nr:hypothetical protein EE612_043505 [Oryza sativa]BAT04911.1 Os08g0326900 [Oryza sativa Japonica Group]
MARRRVSAGAASTPIHQIGIQGRTTKVTLFSIPHSLFPSLSSFLDC